MNAGIRDVQAGAPGAPAAAVAGRPTIAMLIPSTTRRQVLSADAEQKLASFAHVASPAGEAVSLDELPALLSGAVACLTGWGTPPLAEDVLSQCPQLKLIAHTAGTIRRLVPQSAIESGLRVSHAAAIIADAVAEFVIAQALMFLRRPHEIDAAMKDGEDWAGVHGKFPGRLLGSQTVGVVGAGHVGRTVIALLKAFGCRVLVYDPFLTSDNAAALAVEPVGLDEVFSGAQIVTIHLPVLPETHRMIGMDQLRRMHDGTLLINTARSAVVDQEALLRELATGRIVGALDVFDHEPLPADSPFRSLPNVVLSPHVAGLTRDTYLRQGAAMVDEVQRFLAGEPLQYEIVPAMIPIMA